MHYTIEGLVSGKDVGSWYSAAVARWREVLKDKDGSDPRLIAELVANEQFWFEANCGGRFVGQEVMVMAGVGQYYQTDDGFADRIGMAKAMHQGLLASSCSMEVKAHARHAAGIYPELTED